MDRLHACEIHWNSMNDYRLARVPFKIWLSVLSLALSTAAVSAQVEDLGMRFIRVQQEKVHEQMLAGSGGNPWQYRILADALMEPLILAAQARGIPAASTHVFIAFRFFQCLLVFLAAGIYYRLVSLSPVSNVLGLSVLCWGMALSLYNSDLSFSVFFDVTFYLLAAILILRDRPWWVAALMLPAALNRETSALIPLLLGAHAFSQRAPGEARRSALTAAAVGLLVYAAVFLGLRRFYGPQAYLSADGYSAGLTLLLVNLTRAATWQQLLIVLGVIPVLAAIAYRSWPPSLRVFFWVLVPVWIGVHFMAALVAEARLMLVPQVLVFIPGALFGLGAGSGSVVTPARDV
jgi:hypothetical protein